MMIIKTKYMVKKRTIKMKWERKTKTILIMRSMFGEVIIVKILMMNIR